MTDSKDTDRDDAKQPRVIMINLDKVGDVDIPVGDVASDVGGGQVGESLRTTLEAVRGKRDNVVMVRMSTESLVKVDELVDCGLTSSRSEAAAFLIGEGITARHDLYAKIAEQSRVIREAKERLKELLDDEVVPEPDHE